MYRDMPFINTVSEKVGRITTIKILHQSFTMLKMAGCNPIVVLMKIISIKETLKH